MNKKLSKAIVAGLVCTTLGTGVLAAPAKAQAFDWVNAIFAVGVVGAQYAQARSQVNFLDGEGRKDYMVQVKNEVGVNQNATANAMLDRIMVRLSKSIEETEKNSEIKEKPYDYFVNNDQSFNAFCTLGHNLSVNIGLFEQLHYNEDEIAVVVAHELGHGEKKHPKKGVTNQLPLQLIAALYESQNPNSVSILGANIAAAVGNAKLVTKPMENEADKLAFKYYTQAGYNIGAGAAVWQHVIDKLDDNKSSFVTELFNDHPSNVKRRDSYNKAITDYSNGVVKVDANTGTISIHGKEFFTPEASETQSAVEKAFFIAGNLSAVYHDKKAKPSRVWVDGSNILTVGKQQVMYLYGVPNQQQVVQRLKEIL